MGAKVEPVPNLIGESGQALSPVSGRAAPARSVGRGVLARADETGLTALGHEDQFRPPSLNGGCRLGKTTFAELGGKEDDAPFAAVR
jgi:hypothetical protein